MKGQLVSKWGSLWARNDDNLERLREQRNLTGVYVLYDGSMPVYIGRGTLAERINAHAASRKRGQFWDHFSWFVLSDRSFNRDTEALLLRMLPFYLRSLNKMRNRFMNAEKVAEENPVAIAIKRPQFAVKRKRLSSKSARGRKA